MNAPYPILSSQPQIAVGNWAVMRDHEKTGISATRYHKRHMLVTCCVVQKIDARLYSHLPQEFALDTLFWLLCRNWGLGLWLGKT